MNKFKRALIVVFSLFNFTTDVRSEPGEFIPEKHNDFFINKNKPAENFNSIKSFYGRLTEVKSIFPNADVVYSYSSNEVQVCLYDLKQDNRYVVFFYHSHLTLMKLQLDGNDSSKDIQNCYISFMMPGVKNIETRLFGHAFLLREEQSCYIELNTKIDSGEFNLKLNRDKSGWWNGSMKFDEKTRKE